MMRALLVATALAAFFLLAPAALAQSQGQPCGLAWCDVTEVFYETATARTITAAEMRNSMFIADASANMEFQLPPVEPGLRSCFQNFKSSATSTMTLRPDAADRFVLVSGFTEDPGDAITTPSPVGASACMVGVDSTWWAVYFMSTNGSWARE